MGEDSKVIAQEKGYFPDEVHQQDFIQSIRTRKVPNASIEQGQRSATLVHLANLSYRSGEKQLYFDGVNELILNSDSANLLDKRDYRKGFEIADKV